jgi:eukaryotic-like serine/threonine-protein kinase
MPSDAQATAPDRAAGSGEPIRLTDRYEVLPGTVFPNLNSATGHAFGARALRDKRVEPFALICSGMIPPRTDFISTLSNLDSSAVMRPLEWGVIDWTPDRQRRFCIVFERPAGRRLMNSIADTIEPIGEETLTRAVVQPVVSALKEMSSRGLTHGAIRPTNMFFRDLASSIFMMGECASAPPGYGQPVLLETIERGMAMPAGRGSGTIADDLYALGVSLLILYLGRNPVASLDDEQVLQAKIERGSYPALAGQARLSMAINELVRGLLVDDPKQRWTLNDLDLWLSGRRLSPKQPQVARRAARPLEFQGAEYWHCRTLARAFSRYPLAATPVIESGELDKWLRRSMGDDQRAEAVGAAIQTAGGGSKGGSVTDRLVSRVCIALDPLAPIRFKNRAAMPDGIGTALAEAFMRNETPQSVAEILGSQLPMFWANVQPEFKPEYVPMVHGFDQMRGFLDRTQTGVGVERVLYEMNPTVPCLSPMIAARYPLSPIEVLRALDWVGSAGDHKGRDPVDRHIAAFFAARHRRTDELLYGQIAPNVEPMRRNLAMLAVLADVQARTGAEPLPHLARWLVALLDPAFRRFHSRPHQDDVRQQAEAACNGGRLAELIKIVDDPDAMRRDRAGFEAGQIAYREADNEIQKLRAQINDRTGLIEGPGRQMAALAGSVVSAFLVAGIVLLFAL